MTIVVTALFLVGGACTLILSRELAAILFSVHSR
jgi:hypothetical protein